MPAIRESIEMANSKNRKALSIFLTAGFPEVNSFEKLALDVFDAGADMIEIGIPFSDPLADGPVIQHSSLAAIKMGINIRKVLDITQNIAARTDKPVILMGYANPVLNYGRENFFADAYNCGAKGVIIPDVPAEEYDEFFQSKPEGLDTILLAAPSSSISRIKKIDRKSSGFLYCVSMNGTTGKELATSSLDEIGRIRASVTKNKMMIGFGISSGEDIKRLAPYCDGVIVGSKIIKSLENTGIEGTVKLIRDLSSACSIRV